MTLRLDASIASIARNDTTLPPLGRFGTRRYLADATVSGARGARYTTHPFADPSYRDATYPSGARDDEAPDPPIWERTVDDGALTWAAPSSLQCRIIRPVGSNAMQPQLGPPRTHAVRPPGVPRRLPCRDDAAVKDRSAKTRAGRAWQALRAAVLSFSASRQPAVEKVPVVIVVTCRCRKLSAVSSDAHLSARYGQLGAASRRGESPRARSVSDSHPTCTTADRRKGPAWSGQSLS